MAKVTVVSNPIITLTLTKEEAMWLMQKMQNPLHGLDQDTEDDSCVVVREELFSALFIGIGDLTYD